MVKVTDEQIREEWEQMKSIQQIAQALGVGRSTVWKRMKKLGLKAWGAPFAYGYQIKCLDGHKVASMGEARVDDWLFNMKIQHVVHKKLQGLPCVADFYVYLMDGAEIHGVCLEYAGVTGVPAYEKRQAEKKEIYEVWEIPVVWITPETPLDHTLVEKILQAVAEKRRKDARRLEILMRVGH